MPVLLDRRGATGDTDDRVDEDGEHHAGRSQALLTAVWPSATLPLRMSAPFHASVPGWPALVLVLCLALRLPHERLPNVNRARPRVQSRTALRPFGSHQRTAYLIRSTDRTPSARDDGTRRPRQALARHVHPPAGSMPHASRCGHPLSPAINHAPAPTAGTPGTATGRDAGRPGRAPVAPTPRRRTALTESTGHGRPDSLVSRRGRAAASRGARHAGASTPGRTPRSARKGRDAC